jgi:hypothetical protein
MFRTIIEKGDYADWKFLSPSHQGSLKYSMFERGGEFHPELSPKTIGQPVALQIQTLIFC